MFGTYWTLVGVLDAHPSLRNFTSQKKLWSLKIPPKVRNFMWRCAHHILPIRITLSRQGMDINTSCPHCDAEVETIVHALRDCPTVIQVCQVSPCSEILKCDVSLVQWLEELVSCNTPNASSIVFFFSCCGHYGMPKKLWSGRVKVWNLQ